MMLPNKKLFMVGLAFVINQNENFPKLISWAGPHDHLSLERTGKVKEAHS